MQIRPTSLFTASLAVLLAAACSRTNTDTASPEPVVQNPPPVEPTPSSAQAGGAATTDDKQAAATPGTIESLPPEAEVQAPPEYKTTDDEIFGVLETINDEQIDQSQVAKKWAKDKRVKEFAARLIKEHTAANNRQESLRKRLDLRSTDSRLSDDIENDSEQKIDTLQKIAKGDEFDKSYIDIQVDTHTSILDFIDNKLLPHAQMPDLRSELNTVRSSVETHLRIARDIQTALAKPRA